MWKPIAIAITSLLMLILLHGEATAQPSGEMDRVTYEDLAQLGADARGAYDLRDNHFIYSDALEDIVARSRNMYNATIEFEVDVVTVTKNEVYLKVPKAGITIVQILPREFYDMRLEKTFLNEPLTISGYLDYFGPSRTSRFIKYFGPPSTVRYNLIARPASIVIGQQVGLEFARPLRGGDRFQARGRILGVDTHVPANFQGETVVFITDVEAIEDRTLIRRGGRASY